MATSSGICVICTRLAQHDADAAADEQRDDQEPVVLRDDAERWSRPSASAMPVMPYQLPRRAVSWLLRPPSARMKSIVAAM